MFELTIGEYDDTQVLGTFETREAALVALGEHVLGHDGIGYLYPHITEQPETPPVPVTLDDAHAALLSLLTEAVDTETATPSGHLVDIVRDGGADRHTRVVEFALTTTDGRAVGFSATIRVEED